MTILRAFTAFLMAILRALLYGWFVAIRALIREIRRLLRRASRRRRLPGRLAKMSRHRCVPISDPAYKRPDPLIYDQYYLLSQGVAVSWDNPDIQVLSGGVAIPSSALQPDTQYEIEARVWNNSTEAPVIGLPVSFSYLSFGIGTQSHPLPGTVNVDLGVKGGPDHPAFARHPWRTPAIPGHYCIQVQFAWPDDLNPANNLGQENVQVEAASSPANYTFTLRNGTERRLAYRFEADAYAIGSPPTCEEREAERRRAGTRTLRDPLNHIPAAHVRGTHPLPSGWDVSFVPPEPRLAPGEEVTVSVAVTPPDGFHGRSPVNVHAFHGDTLAGGLTLYVEKA